MWTVQRALDGCPTSVGRISSEGWKYVQPSLEMKLYIGRIHWQKAGMDLFLN